MRVVFAWRCMRTWFALLVTMVAVNFVIDLHQTVALQPQRSQQHLSSPLTSHGTSSVTTQAFDEAIVAAAQKAAKYGRGAVILTFIRQEQLSEVSNYFGHVRAAGLTKLLVVIVLDDASARMVRKYDVVPHSLEMHKQAPAGHPHVTQRIRAARWRCVGALVQIGLHVWLSDVRVLWQQGLPASSWAERMPAQCDVSFSQGSAMARSWRGHSAPTRLGNAALDSSSASHVSVGLSSYTGGNRTWHWLARMGQMALSGAGNQSGHATLEVSHSETHALHDELERCDHSNGDELFPCPRWCLLPASHFPNGLATFQQPVSERAARWVQPVAILADWVPSCRFEYRLREAGLWQTQPGDRSDADAPDEKFVAFKELVINNGLSNTRNALRSALAIADLTNRTLILPPMWSRHLVGNPYRVGADYYFDLHRLKRAYPRTRDSSFLAQTFPHAAVWPPQPSTPVFLIQLHSGEGLCAEVQNTSKMEALGNVDETCPPLRLPRGQLRAMRARRYHLGASSDELVRWLAPYASEPLLYFARMFRRFHRFSDATQHDAFQRKYALAVIPAPEIRAVASRALVRLRTSVGTDGRFDCVHMRRRDFVADHAKEELSVEEYARRAADILRVGRHQADEGLPIYLASDVAAKPETKAAFERHFRAVKTLGDVFPAEELDTFTSTPQLSRASAMDMSGAEASEMRFGNVDQLLCSRAKNVRSACLRHLHAPLVVTRSPSARRI